MAVHAHPDDESSKGAASMARYAAEGNDVLVVTLTGGERGDILNPQWTSPEFGTGCPRSARKRWLLLPHARRPADLARLRRLRTPEARG